MNTAYKKWGPWSHTWIEVDCGARDISDAHVAMHGEKHAVNVALAVSEGGAEALQQLPTQLLPCGETQRVSTDSEYERAAEAVAQKAWQKRNMIIAGVKHSGTMMLAHNMRLRGGAPSWPAPQAAARVQSVPPRPPTLFHSHE